MPLPKAAPRLVPQRENDALVTPFAADTDDAWTGALGGRIPLLEGNLTGYLPAAKRRLVLLMQFDLITWKFFDRLGEFLDLGYLVDAPDFRVRVSAEGVTDALLDLRS